MGKGDIRALVIHQRIKVDVGSVGFGVDGDEKLGDDVGRKRGGLGCGRAVKVGVFEGSSFGCIPWNTWEGWMNG
jgi:hypothetical protein